MASGQECLVLHPFHESIWKISKPERQWATMNGAPRILEDSGEVVSESHIGSLTMMDDQKLSFLIDNNVNLFITDPPYNLNFSYGENVKDNLAEDEYKELLLSTFRRCYELAAESASLFIIHYPEALAKIYLDLIEIGWEYRQWISWVYSSNTGHSKNKWSTSHRAILWLTKGNPHFNPRGVMQNFKNPSVGKIKDKKEQGITGVSLYDWWEIPQVKNITSEHEGYKNQIPSALIERIVLCASKPNDIVADPFSGTYSTAKTALRLGRRAWGCDINPVTRDYWPSEDHWAPRKIDSMDVQNIDASDLDPVLDVITQKRYQKVAFKLLQEASIDDLIKHIGPVNGPRVFEALHNQNWQE